MATVEKEYLTIEEFSVLVGTSKQNIYKQLDGRLKDYVVMIKGRKHILRAAANEFYFEPHRIEGSQSASIENNSNQPNFNPNKPCFNSQTTDFNSNQSTENNPSQSKSTAENETYSNIIELLRQELAAKDAQLSEKDVQIKNKDKQIDELHNLLNQQQQLQLASQLQYQTLLDEKKQLEDKQRDNKENTSTEQVEQPQKKGLFGLFKRK